ncbi:MAG TPA: hypothetical protein VFC19_37075 [Candidatus Limnocylindrales bacterium]|nr:hypothetical protein [Candidatus Limnocylindrales bacterium]
MLNTKIALISAGAGGPQVESDQVVAAIDLAPTISHIAWREVSVEADELVEVDPVSDVDDHQRNHPAVSHRPAVRIVGAMHRNWI